MAREGGRSSNSVSSTQRFETAARVMPWRLAMSLIEEHFARSKIPGSLHRRAWRDFGSNRSEALQLCINVSNLKAEVMKPFTFRREEARNATCTVRWSNEFNL